MSVEIEIGGNLYLRITGETLTPGSPGNYSGRPEDCYESEPSELEWSEQYIIKYFEIGEATYAIESAFAECYYDELLDQALEDFDDDLSDRIVQKYESDLLDKMESDKL
jgi:hypothetical protein